MTIGDACHDAIRLDAKLSSEKAPIRPIGGRSAVRCIIRMEHPVERDLVVWEDTRCDRKMLRPREGKEIRLDASRIAAIGPVVDSALVTILRRVIIDIFRVDLRDPLQHRLQCPKPRDIGREALPLPDGRARGVVVVVEVVVQTRELWPAPLPNERLTEIDRRDRRLSETDVDGFVQDHMHPSLCFFAK